MLGMDATGADCEIVITAAADLHGHLPEIGPCELLLLAGDLAPYEIERDAERCREWFTTEFAAWLAAGPAAETIAVAGNHDYWAEGIPAGAHARLFGVDWTYLRDAETTTRSGLRVYGTPWTRDDYDSAFEAPTAELDRIWQAIPSGLDVLITHCPPYGHGDGVTEAGESSHMGTAEMLAAITASQPRLVIFGHAHQAHGYQTRLADGIQLANVSARTDYLGAVGSVSELRISGR